MPGYRIALDALEGDHAPVATIDGALEALSQFDSADGSELSIALFGNPAEMAEKYGRELPPELEVVPTSPAAQQDAGFMPSDTPASALQLALRLHAQGKYDAVVSAGSTGMQVLASLAELEKCAGITRPAVGSLLPTAKGYSFILDVGASLTASPHHLVQFAMMGNIYARYVLGWKEPTIGLLNTAQESNMGIRSAVDANRLLGECGLRNYVGFIEGRAIPSGAADVIVCDGLSGNLLLKYTEGLPAVLEKWLPGGENGELVAALRRQMDFEDYGGEPLLGVMGTSIICHGASSARAIRSAILRSVKIVKLGLHLRLDKFIRDNFSSYFSRVKYFRSFRRAVSRAGAD